VYSGCMRSGLMFYGPGRTGDYPTVPVRQGQDESQVREEIKKGMQRIKKRMSQGNKTTDLIKRKGVLVNSTPTHHF